ncbi:MAG: hypothetical protein M1817_005257 [Caeruleum heppii]|nr:MAG: hypothetical protein M1817_005257 [Caeruleum heppii]
MSRGRNMDDGDGNALSGGMSNMDLNDGRRGDIGQRLPGQEPSSGAQGYTDNGGDRNVSAIKPADLRNPEYSYLSRVYGAQKARAGGDRSVPGSAAQDQPNYGEAVADRNIGQAFSTAAPQTPNTNQPRTREPQRRPYPQQEHVRPEQGRPEPRNYLSGPTNRALQDRQQSPIGPSRTDGQDYNASNANFSSGIKPRVGTSADSPLPPRPDERAYTPRDPIHPKQPMAETPAVMSSAQEGASHPAARPSEGQQRKLSIARKRIGSGPAPVDDSRRASDELAIRGGTPDGPMSSARHDRSASHESAAPEQPRARRQPGAEDTVRHADRPSLEGIVDLRNTVDTEIVTRQAPAVTHETVIPNVHHIREEVITKEIHTHDVKHRIQPVVDVQVLPPRHFIPVHGGLKEVQGADIPGRQSHWQIVETVTPEHSRGKPSSAAVQSDEPLMESSNTYQTAEGHSRTETVWVHPPTLETGAKKTGQSVPLLMDSSRQETYHDPHNPPADVPEQRSAMSTVPKPPPAQQDQHPRVSAKADPQVPSSGDMGRGAGPGLRGLPMRPRQTESPRQSPMHPQERPNADGMRGSPRGLPSDGMRDLTRGQLPPRQDTNNLPWAGARPGFADGRTPQKSVTSADSSVNERSPNVNHGAHGRDGLSVASPFPPSNPESQGTNTRTHSLSQSDQGQNRRPIDARPSPPTPAPGERQFDRSTPEKWDVTGASETALYRDRNPQPDPSQQYQNSSQPRQELQAGRGSADVPSARAPGPRSLDPRPRSRDYSRMNQPPQDYYPAIAGLSGGTDDSGDIRNPKDAGYKRAPEQVPTQSSTNRESSSSVSDTSSTYPEQSGPPVDSASVSDGTLESREANPRSRSSRKGLSSTGSDLVSPQSASATTGLPYPYRADDGVDRRDSATISEPSASEASGASLHNPALETDDNQGMIPVDLSTVGGLSAGDTAGLIPVHPPPQGMQGSKHSHRGSSHHHSGHSGRPRMRDFAKDYIQSIAGTSSDPPGERSVPGGFPGAERDSAL